MSIHLIYAEVVAKARAAYLDGTLQAVHQRGSRTSEAGCSYGECCAIGASLTPDQREDMDRRKSTAIRYLLAEKAITTDSDEGLITLQSVHDRCLCGDRDVQMKSLRQLLGIEEAVA